ncbi:MAG: hypothetical protein AAF531_16055 [Actinomycetota bacterium]
MHAAQETDTRQNDQVDGGASERLLRNTLRVNALSSASTGLFGLVFAGTAGDLIGVDQEWLIRVIGGGLVLFAAAVLLLSRADRPTLIAGTPGISLGDFGWVVASAVVIGLGWLSTRGAVIMGLIAAGVFGFGLVQTLARRRL